MSSKFIDDSNREWRVIETVQYEPPGSYQGTIRNGFLCECDGGRKPVRKIFDVAHYYFQPNLRYLPVEVLERNYSAPLLVLQYESWYTMLTAKTSVLLVEERTRAIEHLSPENLDKLCKIIGSSGGYPSGVPKDLQIWEFLDSDHKQLIEDMKYSRLMIDAPKPPKPVRRPEEGRLARSYQIDTYRCANGTNKEEFEELLEPFLVHQDWDDISTEEWEGDLPDFGPPVYTWCLSDRTEEELLEIVRGFDPNAIISWVSEPLDPETNLPTPKSASFRISIDRLAIDIDEEELQRRLEVDDWSFYYSYGLKGWHTWRVERERCRKNNQLWTPNFPTQLQFPKDKLERLFKCVEKLEARSRSELYPQLLPLIGASELVQIARHECEIENPEAYYDANTLLDVILEKKEGKQ